MACIQHNLVLDQITHDKNLKSRTQQVKLNTELSAAEEIKYGVPQGSVLDPILYLLYVNDLPLNTKFSNSDMYADDATFHTHGKDSGIIQEKLQSDLDSIYKWCAISRLAKFNGGEIL